MERTPGLVRDYRGEGDDLERNGIHLNTKWQALAHRRRKIMEFWWARTGNTRGSGHPCSAARIRSVSMVIVGNGVGWRV